MRNNTDNNLLTLQEMQKTLDQITKKMDALKPDIDSLMECIRSHHLFKEEICSRIVTNISVVQFLSKTCKDLYNNLEESVLPEACDEIQNYITHKTKEVRLEIRQDSLSKFLTMTSDDTETMHLLTEKQEHLKHLIRDNTDVSDEELDQFVKFMDAYFETEAYKIVNYIVELAPMFDSKLLGNAIMNKNVILKDEEKEEVKVLLTKETENILDAEKEEEIILTVEDTLDIQDGPETEILAGEIANEPEVVDKDDEIQNEEIQTGTAAIMLDTVDEQDIENVSVEETQESESIESVTEEKDSERITDDYIIVDDDDFLDEQLLATELLKDKTLKSDIRASENHKIGVKIFKSEILSKNSSLYEIILSMIVGNKHITHNVLTSHAEESDVKEIQFILDYLLAKGYIRKHSITGFEDVYTPSPRLASAIKNASVRKLLHITNEYNLKFTFDETASNILAKLAFMKAQLFITEGEENSKSRYSQCDEHTISEIYLHGKDEKHLFTSSIIDKADDFSTYVDTLFDYCEDEDYDSFTFASLNHDLAKKLAEYFVNEFELAYTDKIFLYSLNENVFYHYESDKKLENESWSDFVHENVGSTDNDEDGSDTEIKDVQAAEDEKETAEEVEESTTAQEVESDVTASEEITEDEPAEVVHDDPVNDILNNIYQMLKEKKFYCATAYLKALCLEKPELTDMYDKLAYAIDDPWKKGSYSSQTLMPFYTCEHNAYTESLAVAAALRNFFLNHSCYDYNVKPFHSIIKECDVVKESAALSNVLYHFVKFKDKYQKGLDYYADFRIKDQAALEKKLNRLSEEAKMIYDNNAKGYIKENASHKRFIETRKLIFAQDGDVAACLSFIANKDYESTILVKSFLEENFMADGCSIDIANVSNEKLNAFIDHYWDKASEFMMVSKKTSDLMSGLRNNLVKSIEKFLKIFSEWVVLSESMNTVKDAGRIRYKEIQKDLLSNLEKAAADIKKRYDMGDAAAAGAAVLEATLQEIIRRVNGTYEENDHKYFYLDFLKGNNVLLTEDYLPDTRGRFDEMEKMSLTNRILAHSVAKLPEFGEVLDYHFGNYGDNYGTAELILNYLQETKGIIYEDYNVKASSELALRDAKSKLEEFIGNLELAQSYGQLEENKENKKEKFYQIVTEWFELTKETNNYGFFKIILNKYKQKITQDAKVRGVALLKEVDQLKNDGSAERTKNIEKIREMIAIQNYTVAEDMLSRIDLNESDEAVEVFAVDYLEKFIREYDYNYNPVANSGRSMRTLVATKIHDKNEKAGKRLLENWMNNGQPMGTQKLIVLLDTLGFDVNEIKGLPKIGKNENYLVTLKNQARRKTFKHPISAFGSRACEDGFRVVCLFGKHDADGLIEEFKNISGSKNTLVLLDYALPLAERRRLARKSKSDMGDKVFAVIDRVLLMFLVNNYNTQFINQILMSTMLPFAYCQPYVWNSSKIMPPEIFIGRKDELEKIESPSGVNLVYGGRQLGKSALLKMARMNIDKNENGDRAVLVELKELDYKQAARKIGHELHDAGILTEDIDTTDWDELARAIKRRLQRDDLPHIPYLLLLLDEADTFIESSEEVNFYPFDALKDIQSVGMDRFKFVLAGLHNIMRFKRDAALSNNSVLTHLTSITVKPFSASEARRLLEEPLYYLGFRFPEDKQSLVSLILANTNYFPGLIQLYCANLIEAMRKNDYAGYKQGDSPVYEIREEHIKKVLTDADFMDQIREKFEITLKLDEDNMYYIIALLMAYLYHENSQSAAVNEGFSAQDIVHVAKECDIKKIADADAKVIDAIMQELQELNILRKTTDNLYLFSRYSFFQMMGTSSEIDDKIMDYMEV